MAASLIIAPALAVAGLAFWKRAEIKRLLAVNTLFNEPNIVGNFSGMNKVFHHTHMPRAHGDPSPLPVGPAMVLPDETAAFIRDRSLTALMVLKDGEIRHEDYYQGTGPDDLRISWSVAKSFLSALFGVLLDEGVIDDINDPVVKYAPSLAGSAYENNRIIDVLRMSSGVVFDEDYLAFSSDINKMARVIALGGSMDRFATKVTQSYAKPGETWQYVSIDTHVIGMVIRGATGRDVVELLQEKILHPLALESDVYYITDGLGTAFVLGGLNLRTRDYARFGQMFLQRGEWMGKQIVPAAWVDASTAPSANTAEGEEQYGFQWWVPVDAEAGEYMARGIYGQYIYINQRLNVVIASNAADRLFREDGVDTQITAMFRALAEAA